MNLNWKKWQMNKSDCLPGKQEENKTVRFNFCFHFWKKLNAVTQQTMHRAHTAAHKRTVWERVQHNEMYLLLLLNVIACAIIMSHEMTFGFHINKTAPKVTSNNINSHFSDDNYYYMCVNVSVSAFSIIITIIGDMDICMWAKILWNQHSVTICHISCEQNDSNTHHTTSQTYDSVTTTNMWKKSRVNNLYTH